MISSVVRASRGTTSAQANASTAVTVGHVLAEHVRDDGGGLGPAPRGQVGDEPAGDVFQHVDEVRGGVGGQVRGKLQQS